MRSSISNLASASALVLLSTLVTACQGPGPGREDRVAQPAAVAGGSAEVEADAEGPEIIESRFGDLEEAVAVGRGKGPDFLEFSRPDDRVVARVGDETLRKSQAFDYLLRTYPDKVRASIAVMLGNRVLAAECERWGIRIGAREIDTWWTEQERQLTRQAKLDLGPTATLEDFVRQRIGQELPEYREVARDRERAKRLLSRLVRFHQIRSDRIELRIVSVTDRDGALQIRKWLKEGAEFAAVARRYSVHPSAENGGRLPPIWRGALHPELDEVAFGLTEGETGPVVHVRDAAGRDRYQIARVLRRLPGREVAWGEVEAQVLASLEKEPLSPDEWTLWQIRVDRLVEVELQGL